MVMFLKKGEREAIFFVAIYSNFYSINEQVRDFA